MVAQNNFQPHPTFRDKLEEMVGEIINLERIGQQNQIVTQLLEVGEDYILTDNHHLSQANKNNRPVYTPISNIFKLYKTPQ